MVVHQIIFKGGSVAEPVRAEPFNWRRSRFKISSGAGAEFFGSAPAHFLASEKLNDLKMFIISLYSILYIFLYNQ